MAACPSWPNPVFAPCSYNARVQSCFARNEKAAWQEAAWVCKTWTLTPRGFTRWAGPTDAGFADTPHLLRRSECRPTPQALRAGALQRLLHQLDCAN